MRLFRRIPVALFLLFAGLFVVFAGLTHPSAGDISVPKVGLRAEALPNFHVLLSWNAPLSETEFNIIRIRVKDGEFLDPRDAGQPVPIPWAKNVPGCGPADGIPQTYVDAETLPGTQYRYEVRPPRGGSGPWETVQVKISPRDVDIIAHDVTAETLHMYRTFIRANGDAIAVASRQWQNSFPATRIQIFARGSSIPLVDDNVPNSWIHPMSASDKYFAIGFHDTKCMGNRCTGTNIYYVAGKQITPIKSNDDGLVVGNRFIVRAFPNRDDQTSNPAISIRAIDDGQMKDAFREKLCERNCDKFRINDLKMSDDRLFVALSDRDQGAVRIFKVENGRLSLQYEQKDPVSKSTFGFANSMELSPNLMLVENKGPIHQSLYEITVDAFQIDSGTPTFKGRVVSEDSHQQRDDDNQSIILPVRDKIFGLFGLSDCGNDCRPVVKIYNFEKGEWRAIADNDKWKKEKLIPIAIAAAPDALEVVLKKQVGLGRVIRAMSLDEALREP